MNIALEDLPTTIPLFPLSGAVVFPRAQLPLHIFEPRYLAMVSDALAGPRTIGMVQPRGDAPGQQEPPVYPVGCAGRLTSFQELDDGRNMITLSGLCRFEIIDELERTTPYRQFVVSYDRFAADLSAKDEAAVDREALLATVSRYVARQELKSDWESIEQADTETLVNALGMLCPFTPSEKQALMEAADFVTRCEILRALLEMAGNEDSGTGSAVQ